MKTTFPAATPQILWGWTTTGCIRPWIHVKDMLGITGYIRGGCSPVGMKKHFPTYIEEMAQLYDTVMVSAGQRGVQVTLSPEDLRSYVEGQFVSLV